MDCILKYKIFKNIGKASNISQDYKNIRVHFIYDMKHNNSHQARLVTNKYLTDFLINGVYSGIVFYAGSDYLYS